ncbi:response regulator [Salinarimonas sp. NSM]|uniref:response regulator n=1 Tax=Salinarimonas sp. NSM TaxID=3458003 RepID=UPI00403715B9
MSVRILICEDNPLIALDLQAIVENNGHEVVGVCDSAAAASRMLATQVDVARVEFALLDIDLTDGKSFGIAQALGERGVPFAFVSAARPSDLPESLRSARFVAKPYREDAILAALPRH